MKKRLSYMAFGLAALLGACTGDDPSVAAWQEARISATIGRASRAIGSRWERGDCIGVTAVGGARANMPYTTAEGDGNFAYSGSAVKFLFMDFATVDFSAYYPFSGAEGTIPTSIAVNTADQSAGKSFDYLYATASGSAITPEVNFQFRHVMTQVVFNLKSGQYTAEELERGAYAMTNVSATGSFNPSDGAATVAETSAKAEVVGASYAGSGDVLLGVGMILLPQSISGASFKATIGTVTYQVAIPDRVLEAGKSYVYDVALTVDGITMAPCTIAERVDGGTVGATGELEI